MRSPISTHAALLQALRQSAGYGLELIRRVEETSAGSVRLAEARVYPTLNDLRHRGLVTASCVTPGGRRGARSRTCYELTLHGVEASTRARATLRALATVPPSPLPARQVRLMTRRIEQADRLSAFARGVRDALHRRS